MEVINGPLCDGYCAIGCYTGAQCNGACYSQCSPMWPVENVLNGALVQIPPLDFSSLHANMFLSFGGG